MRSAGLDGAQAGIKIAGRNINNLRYADDTTVVLEKTLESPWTARRSNQSILKEISLGCSLEGMMLKLNSSTLATSCEELTHWKSL